MSNSSWYKAAVSRLAAQSDAVGRLAQDSGGFAAVVAAFESKDPDAFRWVLERLEMVPYCDLICEWVRVKMCVLRCFEVCGPPPENVETPSLQQFANAAVKLASNEKLLRRVVDAVSCGDGDAYRAAIQELELKEFCHLICHWVCSIIYRRVCDVVCRPTPVPVYDAASEIRASGRVIASLVANKTAFNAISEAAVALNCETLQSSIQETGFGRIARSSAASFVFGDAFGRAEGCAGFASRIRPGYMASRRREISRWQPGNSQPSRARWAIW